MTLKFQKPVYLLTTLTPPTLLFIKNTFFLFYLQVFKPMRWLRISAYVGILVTTTFYLGMTGVQFAFATPRRGEGWFAHELTSNEHWVVVLSVPQSAVGLVIDLYILVLPLIAVSQLQLATRRRFGVILVFMTGILYENRVPFLQVHHIHFGRACLSSSLNVYYRYTLNHTSDFTWSFTPVNTVTHVSLFSSFFDS